MKRTIKLLTLALMLATISMFTGCNCSVTPDKPCTHEHTKTDVVKEATCIEDGLEQTICVDCEEVLEEQKLPIDPENHDWVLESDTATCTEDGVKTHKCSRCDETRIEDITAHHTFIAGGCDKCGTYEYSGTQVKVYVYTLTKEEELNDLGILYYSFEETDKTMELNDLLHLKPEYKDYTVAYCRFQFFPTSDSKYLLTSNGRYIPWEDKLNYPIGIIIEPQTN